MTSLAPLVPLSEIESYPQPEVHILWPSKQIQLQWSPRIKSPYSITFDRIQTLNDVVGWMAHLAEKTWFYGQVSRDLGNALITVYNKQTGA